MLGHNYPLKDLTERELLKDLGERCLGADLGCECGEKVCNVVGAPPCSPQANLCDGRPYTLFVQIKCNILLLTRSQKAVHNSIDWTEWWHRDVCAYILCVCSTMLCNNNNNNNVMCGCLCEYVSDYERERVNEQVHVCVHVCPLFPSSLWWWVRQRLGAIGGIWQGHGMFQKYLELRTQVNDTHVLPSPRVITQIKKTKDREQGSEMSVWAMWDHWQMVGPLAKTDIAELGWSSGPCSCWRDLNIHEQGDHNSRLVLAVALITIHVRPVSSWIFSGSWHGYIKDPSDTQYCVLHIQSSVSLSLKLKLFGFDAYSVWYSFNGH